MKQQALETCPECTYWEKVNRPTEWFSFGWGTIKFNITRALKIIDELRLVPESVDIEYVRPFVIWPKPPEAAQTARSFSPINLMTRRLNYDHVAHVDPTAPIIMATFEIDDSGPQISPIDGHHRIARALQDGRTEIPAYVLNVSMTKKIMRRRRK